MSENGFTTNESMCIEYLLKESLARRMGALQEDRMTGPGRVNLGNAEDYVTEARALRTLLEQSGRQRYKPLRDFHGTAKRVSDDIADEGDMHKYDSMLETLDNLHSLANPHLPVQTLTHRQSVPGSPGR